jgi:large subunit ribosomal protein L10
VAAFLLPDPARRLTLARPEKEAAVREIANRFNEVDAALLTEYRGLSVTDIAEVRNSLREVDADYKVLKNTLARLAVKEVGLDDLLDLLEGPTAIAFIRGDAVEAAKALDSAVDKHPVLVVKGGMLKGGRIIDAEEAKRLAKIESREVLLTQLAMMANQPAQKLATVFSALLRDLGSMLAQVVTKKESGELPGGTGETAAEEPAREEPAAKEEPAADGSGAAEGSNENEDASNENEETQEAKEE